MYSNIYIKLYTISKCDDWFGCYISHSVWCCWKFVSFVSSTKKKHTKIPKLSPLPFAKIYIKSEMSLPVSIFFSSSSSSFLLSTSLRFLRFRQVVKSLWYFWLIEIEQHYNPSIKTESNLHLLWSISVASIFSASKFGRKGKKGEREMYLRNLIYLAVKRNNFWWQ